MNKRSHLSAIVFLLCFLSSCQAIGGIFKTGVWFGVIIVVVIIGLIIYFITKSKN